MNAKTAAVCLLLSSLLCRRSPARLVTFHDFNCTSTSRHSCFLACTSAPEAVVAVGCGALKEAVRRSSGHCLTSDQPLPCHRLGRPSQHLRRVAAVSRFYGHPQRAPMDGCCHRTGVRGTRSSSLTPSSCQIMFSSSRSAQQTPSLASRSPLQCLR